MRPLKAKNNEKGEITLIGYLALIFFAYFNNIDFTNQYCFNPLQIVLQLTLQSLYKYQLLPPGTT